MHYHAEVWIKKASDLHTVHGIVKRLNISAWHQIGGRWTGAHTGYDPSKDPRNIEVCCLCKGTGKREDEIGNKAREENPEYTCNGCDGTGMSVKWPTQWAPYEGDTIEVSKIKDDFTCYVLIIDRRMIESEGICSSINVVEELKKLNITDGYLVTVDFHE